MKKTNLIRSVKLIFVAAVFSMFIPACEIGLGSEVDLEPPVVTIDSPVPTGSVSKEFTVRGSASDNSGVKDLTLTINETGQKYMWNGIWNKMSGGSWVPCEEATFSGDSKKFDWSITLSINGAKSGESYSMSTVVTDLHGNSGGKSKDDRNFTVDVVEPVVLISLPELMTTYSEASSNAAAYALKDSLLLLKLINSSFTIDGTQKEDTRLSNLYVMIDRGTEDTIVSYDAQPDLRATATDLICFKSIEGSRSWNTSVDASEIPEAYRTGKQIFRVVTESHDLAGNIERKVQGWFVYWNEADLPWVVANFGDEAYLADGQKQVYPSCALQGQCYDDDGLSDVNVKIYVYDDTTATWQLKNEKSYGSDIAKENNPTYYAWSVNSISDNKHFKVVSKCTDIYGNQSEEVVRFLSIADVNPPQLEVLDPQNGSTVIGDAAGNFTISGTVNDDGALDVDRCLKIVRIANDQKTSLLNYFNADYDGWKSELNGNKLYEIKLSDLTGYTQGEGGYYKYTFKKTFNIFNDFDVGKVPAGKTAIELINSQNFVIKASDDKSSTIQSYTLQGDTEAPQLTIDKIYVKDAGGNLKKHKEGDIEYNYWKTNDDNPPVLPPFDSGDKIYYSGTWRDNSTALWNSDASGKLRIGDFVLESKDGSLTGRLSAPSPKDAFGTWTSDPIAPGVSTTGSLNVSLTDFGGNTTKKSTNYYISSSLPKLVRISSVNPDGAYKAGTKLTLTMEYNKKVTFTGEGAILTLNNDGTAVYDSTSNTNGSAKHYYTYTVGDKKVDKLNVDTIYANGTTWKDSDENIITVGEESKMALPELNLQDVRSIKIDLDNPIVKEVKAITPNGFYTINKEMYFTIEFDKDVTYTNLSDVKLNLKVGSVEKPLSNPSQTSAKTLLYTYKVVDGDNGKITFNSITTGTSEIKDKAGNKVTNFTPYTETMGDITVDTAKPNVPEIQNASNNELVYAAAGKTVRFNYEEGCEKYYSVDNGTTWSQYPSSGISLTNNGTYKIMAYQVDKAGNESDKSTMVQVTLDTGNILTSITSSNPDGTYTSGDTISIVLNFRKPVIVKGSQLKLNVKDKTNASTVIDATPVEEPAAGAKSIKYNYVVGSNDMCDKLEVADNGFTYTSITDATAAKNNISPYVPLPDATSGNRLSDNREIKIVTGDPTITKVELSEDGKTFDVYYDCPVTKKAGNIVFKMKENTFKAPAVMSISDYGTCSSNIQHYYKEGTNGSSNLGVPDSNKKYILDYATETTDSTLVAKFISDGKDTVTVPVDSTAVTIVDDKILRVDISDAYKLPVKGNEYVVTVPAGLVKNVLEKSSTAIPSYMENIRAPGVEAPYIRINKAKETISGTTVEQPLTAKVKIDCQTADSRIYYVIDEKKSSTKIYDSVAITKDAARTTSPAMGTNPDANYTGEFSIGSPLGGDGKPTDNSNGYSVLIGAKVYITVGGTKRWSDPNYETAYRTVVRFIDKTGSYNDYNRWVRGGDWTSGGVSTPDFPLSWNREEYDKIRAMTSIGNNTWVWVTWQINTTAYVGFIAGDMPADAADNGPQNWCWGSCAWVGLKSEYPVYPGQSLTLISDSNQHGRGGYGYQDKHKESR